MDLLKLKTKKQLSSIRYSFKTGEYSPCIDYKSIFNSSVERQKYFILKGLLNLMNRPSISKHLYQQLKISTINNFTKAIQENNIPLFMFFVNNNDFDFTKHNYDYLIRAYESGSEDICYFIFKKVKDSLMEDNKQFYQQIQDEIVSVRLKDKINKF